MSLNRLVDAELDARNPRTADARAAVGRAHARAGARPVRGWHSPSSSSPCSSSIRSSAGCGPIPVAMFVVYPYLKRVTWLCHVWLGACLGLAPVGAWLAVYGHGAVGGVGDRCGRDALGRRLRSLLLALRPRARSGGGPALVGGALRRARRVHRRASVPRRQPSCSWLRRASASTSRSSTGSASSRPPPCSSTSTRIVRPGDLRRLDAAFFTLNGVISVVFFAFVALDVLVG